MYIGVFDQSPFEEFKILAEKLVEYNNLIKNSNLSDRKNVLKRIESQLYEGLSTFANPIKLKKL